MMWISTLGNGHFDLANPRAEDVHPEHVATALSRITRWTGQLDRGTVSVAQHSLLVWVMLHEARPTVSKLEQFRGLVHDAAEAYIGDVAAPLKSMLPDYQAIESRVEAAVAQRFGLASLMSPMVKLADRAAMLLEASMLANYEWAKEIDANSAMMKLGLNHEQCRGMREQFSEIVSGSPGSAADIWMWAFGEWQPEASE